jgi:hypothetical protein
MKLFRTLVFFFASIPCAWSQLNNDAFFEPASPDSMENRSFALSLDHLNFLKNNEYFGKIVDGRTFFGLHAIPRLHYQAHPRFRIEGGLFARKDYGAKGFQQLDPVFTARYMAGPNQILMGTLDGGLEHNLIEPLYDFENQLIRRLEYGFQWKHKSAKWRVDAWLDWRNMIYPNSSEKEQLVGGLVLEPTLYEGKRTKIQLSFQGNAYHRGGQIDTLNQPLLTWLNGAAGLRIRTIPGHGIILKHLEFQGYSVGFRDQSNQKSFDFSQSASLYINLKAKTLWFDLMLSYWQGNNFVSYQGGALFSSLSSGIKNQGYFEAGRQLLIIRLLKDWQIAPNIWISARLEPYLDLKSNSWEFSHGLYFNFRGQLWKSKPQ